MADRHDWVEIFRTHDQVEAEVVKGLLETNRFPVVVEAKGLKAMPSIFGHASYGQLIIKVPPDLAEQARALLEAPVEPSEEEA